MFLGEDNKILIEYTHTHTLYIFPFSSQKSEHFRDHLLSVKYKATVYME